MQTRRTMRVLLFDAGGRLLLMRMHDPDVADSEGRVAETDYWLTIGGEIEAGETEEEAARREVFEETGLLSIRLGPAIWTADHILTIRGEKRRLQERFILAWVKADAPLSHAGWTEGEQRSVRELRWWTAAELAASSAIFFPSRLKKDIPALLAGEYPDPPMAIDL